MAEFLTMAEAEDKFGKKGRTNAASHLVLSEQHLVHSQVITEVVDVVMVADC